MSDNIHVYSFSKVVFARLWAYRRLPSDFIAHADAYYKHRTTPGWVTVVPVFDWYIVLQQEEGCFYSLSGCERHQHARKVLGLPPLSRY